MAMRRRALLAALPLLPLAAAPSLAQRADTRPLLDLSGPELSPDRVHMIPGVFRVDPAGRVDTLCVPSNGRWLRVERTPTPCPIDPATGEPPAALKSLSTPAAENAPAMVVWNLGVTTEEWRRAQAPGASPALRQVARAAQITGQSGALRWRFDSDALPEAMRNEIPGSGTGFQLGIVWGQRQLPPVFEGGSQGLLVETRLAMPELDVTGEATSGVTIGMVFQLPDTQGRVQPIIFIVGLFNSRFARPGERVASDGRNDFVEVALSRDARLVDQVSGTIAGRPWQGMAPFAFRLNRDTFARLVQALSAARQAKGQTALAADLDRLRLKSVSLRNESRQLDRGHVRITLDTELLRVSRLAR